MPIPAAPIPDCALPVPMSPPAIAIEAAKAKIGLANAESLDFSSAANAGRGEMNVKASKKTPVIIAKMENVFLLEITALARFFTLY